MSDWLNIVIPFIGFFALNHLVNNRTYAFFRSSSWLTTLTAVAIAYVAGFLIWIMLTESHIIRKLASDYFIFFVVAATPVYALLYRFIRRH